MVVPHMFWPFWPPGSIIVTKFASHRKRPDETENEETHFVINLMSCSAYPNLSPDLDHYRLDFSRCRSDMNSINISDADILLVIFSPSSQSHLNFLFACLLVREIMAAPSTLPDWRDIWDTAGFRETVYANWLDFRDDRHWYKIKSVVGCVAAAKCSAMKGGYHVGNPWFIVA